MQKSFVENGVQNANITPEKRKRVTVGRIKFRVLTVGQFETIRPFLRISAARIDAARMAMVEDFKFEEISKVKGWKSKQAVDRAVANVWSTWKKYEESQELAARYNEQQGS